MIDSTQTKINKKVYKKPQITIVQLVAEEAVLANCKSEQGGLSFCTDDQACWPNSTSTS